MADRNSDVNDIQEDELGNISDTHSTTFETRDTFPIIHEEKDLESICNVAMDDLLVSCDMIDTCIKSQDYPATEAELEDINATKDRFIIANDRLLKLCKDNVDKTSLYMDKRRKFLLLFKSERNRLVNIISKKEVKTSEPDSGSSATVASKSNLRLPKVNIPIFDGEFNKWIPFKNLYMSLIDNSTELSDLEKHSYLRSLLSGQSDVLVRNIAITANNYQTALDIIKKHYDDPYRQLNGHFHALYSAPQVNIKSKNSLRNLIVQFRQHVAGLKNIFAENTDIEPLSQCLIYWFLIKADKNSRADWERELAKSKSFSNFEDFIDFMDARCSAYERATENLQTSESTGQKSTTSNSNVNINKKSKISLPLMAESSSSNDLSNRHCVYCKLKGHFIPSCSQFRELAPEDRFTFVKKRRLCHFCFRGNCDAKLCAKRPCYKCKGKHNTLLHVGKKPDESLGKYSCILDTVNQFVRPGIVKADYSVNLLKNDNDDTLLATVIIKVKNESSITSIEVRALIDSCSQLNFISQNLVRKLNIHPYNTSFSLNAIAGLKTNVDKQVNINISSINSKFSQTIPCIVLKNIVKMLPEEQFTINHWNIPPHISLADPHFNIPSNIDMLLGVKVFWNVLGLQKIILGPNLPILWKSKLGWLITGSLEPTEFTQTKCILYVQQTKNNLCKILEKFWKVEEINKTLLTPDDIKCERIYEKTTCKKPNGNLQVSLPFKHSSSLLGKSKQRALKRFYYLEKRLSLNPNLKKAYIDGMRDYINKNHFVEINIDNESEIDSNCYYLAHHAVIKDSSSSTRIRIVFDASMESSSGFSLNDLLHIGPVVQNDLFTILIQFRLKKYVFVADIVQMYRQINMDPAHTKFQRIIWRENETDSLRFYESVTVTFGTSAAPYLATRSLKKLAEDSGEMYPLAKPVLLNNFYVDDVLAGADSLEQTINLQSQLIELLKTGNFELSKWCANHPELLKNIPIKNVETRFPLCLGDSESIKALGLLWSHSNDTFKIWLHMKDIKSMTTKREILAAIGSIFDPYGLVAPVIIKAKLFMQLLWQTNALSAQGKKLKWNDAIPDELLQLWINYAQELLYLNEIEIPRFVFPNSNLKFVELHGYCDASEKAYGAVLYIRSSTQMGRIHVKLLCAKTRVAPLKKLSLPRLELCAALLLAELTDKIVKILQANLNLNIVRLWSDSSITLSWINAPSARWQTFVANRVQKIQDLCYNYIWDHISGKNNPADILSRGVEPSKLKNCDFWFNGPQELYMHNNNWGTKINFKTNEFPNLELRKRQTLSLLSLKGPHWIFRRYSQFSKLVRVVAFLFRFSINASKISCKITDSLKNFEYDNALVALIKLAQQEVYIEEFTCLKLGKTIANKSTLKTLCPFLDNYNIIRVGGRLDRANLSFEQRHPALLPASHPLSLLIIRYEHLKNHHAGNQLLKSIIRRKFWMTRVNNAIQKIIYECIICTRFRAKLQTQFMANLPKARVVPCKPFNITGIDYTGAVQILERGGPRQRKIIKKGYIAVFVCFTTKAIHLELVSDLTSVAFLAALTRFVSRRGVPLEIYSDNGTTFVGANTELLRLKDFLIKTAPQIANFTLEQNINWHFTPPYSPHFGGLWEAGVKSVKKHLKTIMSELPFTFEQLTTLLTQIEAILNSRPLCPESNDPNDLNALTPGHFLIGGPITALPNPDYTDLPQNRLKYWESIKQLSQKFWKRWSTEYLNSLQQRTKWRIAKRELKIGDLILIKEDNLPPTHWKAGRVTQLHPGADGHVRVVSLKTKDAEIKRPIVKLILLPCD